MAIPKTHRLDYHWFVAIAPRWRDNDIFGHVNNAVFYEYVDTIVNSWILEEADFDVLRGPIVGLTAESGCTYYEPLAFPDPISAGLRVARIGNSSVRYEVGLFRGTASVPAAEAFFVHVYVDRQTKRPVALSPAFRSALGKIAID